MMRVTTNVRSPATICCPRRYMDASLRPLTVTKHCSPRTDATQRLNTLIVPPVEGAMRTTAT
jgi:hypothetical protein